MFATFCKTTSFPKRSCNERFYRISYYFPNYDSYSFIYRWLFLSSRFTQNVKPINQLASIKVGLSPFKKNFFICFNNSPSKVMKNAFYFILKALFVLKIFKFLSWLFGHIEKTASLEILGWFRNLWRHSLVNKELQHPYCSISHELKATR